MSKSERAQALADDLPHWIRSRRFFGPPQPKHILAMLSMPDTGGEPPDAPLSADMAAFYLGVIGLPDEIGRPFIRIYCKFPKEKVEYLAAKEQISLRTYYNRAEKGAKEAIASMRKTLTMLDNMRILERVENYAHESPARKQGNMVSSLSR